MERVRTFMNRILALGVAAGLLASCSSSKIGMIQTAPVDQNVAITAPATEQEDSAPAAAQGAQSDPVYASTSGDMATVTTVNVLDQARQESKAVAAATAHKKEAKKVSLPARLAAKAVMKKLEKASHKFDVKKDKAVSDPQIRTGIIIALVGLGLTLVGALTGLWFLYTLGGIGITVGLIIILLAALDVI